MELLEAARKSLNKSLSHRRPEVAQAYALDSIAASLIHIAENLNTTTPQVDEDKIELVVRRLLDATKEPSVKRKKVGKKQ